MVQKISDHLMMLFNRCFAPGKHQVEINAGSKRLEEGMSVVFMSV